MTGISSTGNPSRGRTARTSIGLRRILVAGVAAILFASLASAAGVAGTARLIRERRAHTATAIGNGKILVAGGQNLSGALSDVEIFDSATGTFTAGARLLTPRAEQTATRLADGRVLLVGGRGTEPLISTEFYDASRNVFSSGPSLNSSRFGHTATLLPDGRVVVTGGNAEGTAEIFDPRANTFSALPCRLSEPRRFHAAVRLLDGSILIAGGIGHDGAKLRSAEILHPDILECEPVATMFVARSHFVLRLLPDGKVQAIGGDADSTMELFNPAGYFSSLVHLARAAEFESAVLRSAGRVAMIGPNAPAVLDADSSTIAGRQTVRQVQNLLDRIDYSVTEVPESGAAMVAGGVNSAGRYQQTAVLFDASSATVTTDKTDYAPGEIVVITGTDWLPGETVTLSIHRDTNDPPDTVLSAVADANGNIENSDYVVQQYDLGVTFLLTATGQTSGYTAQTSFTDGNVRVRSNAAGTTFTLTWKVFSGTTCAGLPTSTGTELNVGFAGGARFTKGVGNTESISLEAAATATTPAGQPFIAWTSADPFTPIAPRTICVSGQFSGTREYVANYGCAGQAAGFVCRPATDACDAAETCDGVSLLCPADALAPNGAVCRSGSGDLCDPDETCTGSSAACPADTVAPATTVCNPGSGDQCDPDELCTGTAGQACPTDTVAPATTVCNPGSGDQCDPDELCTGVADQACPADVVAPATTVCNPGSGDQCDPDELCTGTAGQACPTDTVAPATTVCNPGSGDQCDPDELCTGVADQACPADVVAPATTVCNPGSGDQCDPDELCTGTAGQACPTDTVAPATTVCNPGSGDQCDPDELCTGVADQACPADVIAPATTVCNPGSGDQCDPDELCTGVADQACPADTVASAGTTCRAAGGVCDAVESCTGAADAACPADAKKGPETTCRGTAGECDLAEVCDGASNDCPGDLFKPAATSCFDEGVACTVDQCNGISAECTHTVIPNCGGFACTDSTNTPPVVTSVIPSTTNPIQIGGSVQVTGTFTDASLLQTHMCSISWDDGTTDTFAATTESTGGSTGTCVKSHSYGSPGVYTVSVTVTDSCGAASNTLLYQFVVVYDPAGGFVTGGGWINQPPDGYPALPGKANFGFVSKYKKGSNVPDGETEFQFKAGDINFHSSSYDYGSLVISGGKKATYRGDGTVNGVPGYRFLLIAWDGQASGGGGVDRFRIKITQGGTLVYDNRPLASEDVDLADPTALGGGSIVIHK